MLQILLFIPILTINEVTQVLCNHQAKVAIFLIDFTTIGALRILKKQTCWAPPTQTHTQIGNLDTDLFGIADPEGEVMKTDKLSPRGLKGQTEDSYLLIVSLSHSVMIHACSEDLTVTQSGIFSDVLILPSPPYLCSLSKNREEM